MASEDRVSDAETRSIATGASALKAGEWMAARDAFQEALTQAESPEALNGLSEAFGCLGETVASCEYMY